MTVGFCIYGIRFSYCQPKVLFLDFSHALACKIPKQWETKLCLQNFEKNFQYEFHYVEKSDWKANTVDPDERAHYLDLQLAHYEPSHLEQECLQIQLLECCVWHFTGLKVWISHWWKLKWAYFWWTSWRRSLILVCTFWQNNSEIVWNYFSNLSIKSSCSLQALAYDIQQSWCT